MIRHHIISILTSLLLTGVISFTDVSQFYFESDELVETVEFEREEIEEDSEGKEWSKLFPLGSAATLIRSNFSFGCPGICAANPAIGEYALPYTRQIPLFLRYCCLKVHL